MGASAGATALGAAGGPSGRSAIGGGSAGAEGAGAEDSTSGDGCTPEMDDAGSGAAGSGAGNAAAGRVSAGSAPDTGIDPEAGGADGAAPCHEGRMPSAARSSASSSAPGTAATGVGRAIEGAELGRGAWEGPPTFALAAAASLPAMTRTRPPSERLSQGITYRYALATRPHRGSRCGVLVFRLFRDFRVFGLQGHA
jgi:hypothetical protein